jgi:aspartate-semialdehyde dehydrogenase
MKKYNVAVVGATGNVGRMVLDYLSERGFPVDKIEAYASDRSLGKEVQFGDNIRLKIKQLSEIDFKELDFVFLCAGSEVSKKYAEEAVANNCIVIDKSSFFRLRDGVPLVVPEANMNALKGLEKGIIANPNCCVIPLAVALKPLDNIAKIKRVVVSTYQSVSGAGKKAMDELYSQTKAKYIFEELEPKIFPTQIAFNLFPQVGHFLENGYTDEEYKIAEELKKIIGQQIKVTVTSVRVPVFVTHSMSVNVEFEKSITAEEASEVLSESDGVIVHNHENEHKYATPVDATESDEVYVSRIREDHSAPNALNMWVVCDNLRKGAALNAVQIAELVINTKSHF